MITIHFYTYPHAEPPIEPYHKFMAYKTKREQIAYIKQVDEANGDIWVMAHRESFLRSAFIEQLLDKEGFIRKDAFGKEHIAHLPEHRNIKFVCVYEPNDYDPRYEEYLKDIAAKPIPTEIKERIEAQHHEMYYRNNSSL